MPTPKHKRDYKKEYKRDHASRKAKKDRAARVKARREAIRKGTVSKGDAMEVDHIKPLSKGGSNRPSNRRVVTRKQNRRKARKY